VVAVSFHPTWAAEHLELAALASLDLDRDDRSVVERAADALLEAGDRSRRRMESRTAIDYYERALALVGPEERWGVREARALAGIGEARYWLGEYRAATEVLDRAVELGRKVEDPFALALSLRFLGDVAINVEGNVDKAERSRSRRRRRSPIRGRSPERCCSPGGCRGRGATTGVPRRSGAVPSRSPMTRMAWRGFGHSTRSRSTRPVVRPGRARRPASLCRRRSS